MEELSFLDTTLFDWPGLGELMFRFVFNSFFAWFIIQKLYYPKSMRKDYYFTFTMISVSIFFLIFLLGSVKIKVGFALGLFAIFGIIRYRTESMSVREMTYLFVIIAISVINALAIKLSYTELLVTNVLFLLCIKWGESLYWLKHVSEKWVLYDRIDLITPQNYQAMVNDLQQRLGLSITKVEVGAVDFLRDTVMLKVFYYDSSTTNNEVNKQLKLPKEQKW